MLTIPDSKLVTSIAKSPNYHVPANRRTRLFVMHDVESPLKDSYAVTLAGPAWFGKKSAKASAHYMVGPRSLIQMVDERAAAWAVGPNANSITVNAEQTGYARFSRAEWLSPAGRQQIAKMGALIADWAKRHGATTPPQRATVAQIDAYAAGDDTLRWCIHWDITNSLAGTSHTDTGSNYPLDLLQQEINNHFGSTPEPPQEELTMASADCIVHTQSDGGAHVYGLFSGGKIIYIDQTTTLNQLRERCDLPTVNVSQRFYNSCTITGKV